MQRGQYEARIPDNAYSYRNDTKNAYVYTFFFHPEFRI